jgi:hypothetical protein
MSFPAFVLASLLVAATTSGAVLLSRSRWTSVPAAFAGAMALLLIHALGFFRYFADDSYITFRYSRNLADGIGPTWNAGVNVEGYTNFSWMLILALFSKFGADLVITSQVLGGVATAITFVGVYLLWRRWSDDEPESGIGHPMVLCAMLTGIAFTGALPFWGFSGMETALFTAFLTLGAALYISETRHDRAVPWSAVVFAGAALTRPEGAIAAAVTGVFVLSRTLDPERRAIEVRRATFWLSTFGALYIPYFTWRMVYYGHLLPNTFYAKVEPTSALYDRGLDYVWTYGTRYLLPAMFVGMAVLAKPSFRRDAVYLMALTGTLLGVVIFEGGENFAHGRLIVPVLPLAYAGGIAGLAMALKQLPLTGRQPALIATFALTLAALALLRSSHDLIDPIRHERDAMQQREALGRWLEEYTPPDYTIAAFAVGAIGYETERPVLDMLGLNDPVIAHTNVPNVGKGFGGHEKYNIDYVLDTARPEIIVINDGEAGPVTEEQLRAATAGRSSPVPARDALFADSRLWARYDVRSLELDGVWYNFLQRSDTIAFLQAPQLR